MTGVASCNIRLPRLYLKSMYQRTRPPGIEIKRTDTAVLSPGSSFFAHSIGSGNTTITNVVAPSRDNLRFLALHSIEVNLV